MIFKFHWAALHHVADAALHQSSSCYISTMQSTPRAGSPCRSWCNLRKLTTLERLCGMKLGEGRLLKYLLKEQKVYVNVKESKETPHYINHKSIQYTIIYHQVSLPKWGIDDHKALPVRPSCVAIGSGSRKLRHHSLQGLPSRGYDSGCPDLTGWFSNL